MSFRCKTQGLCDISVKDCLAPVYTFLAILLFSQLSVFKDSARKKTSPIEKLEADGNFFHKLT